MSPEASHSDASELARPDGRAYAIRRAVELVTTSSARVSLGQLVSHTGVSKFHLVREFARLVGEPPGRYQQLRRLRRAAHLLRSGHRPIDVAYQLGYADQAHLSRHFKQQYGMPPGAYARANRQERAAKTGDGQQQLSSRG